MTSKMVLGVLALAMTVSTLGVGCADETMPTSGKSKGSSGITDDNDDEDKDPASTSTTKPGNSSNSSGTASPQSLGCGPGDVPSAATQLPLTVVMGGEPPKAAGGDPKGTWLAQKATLILPKAAALKYSEKKSGGKAKAWGVFDGKATRLQIAVNLELVSDRGEAEKLDLAIEGNGDYAAKGEVLDIAWSCPQKLLDPSVDATFSATGTGGTLVQKLKTSAGDAYFVIEASKR